LPQLDTAHHELVEAIRTDWAFPLSSILNCKYLSTHRQGRPGQWIRVERAYASDEPLLFLGAVTLLPVVKHPLVLTDMLCCFRQ